MRFWVCLLGTVRHITQVYAGEEGKREGALENGRMLVNGMSVNEIVTESSGSIDLCEFICR